MKGNKPSNHSTAFFYSQRRRLAESGDIEESKEAPTFTSTNVQLEPVLEESYSHVSDADDQASAKRKGRSVIKVFRKRKGKAKNTSRDDNHKPAKKDERDMSFSVWTENEPTISSETTFREFLVEGLIDILRLDKLACIDPDEAKNVNDTLDESQGIRQKRKQEKYSKSCLGGEDKANKKFTWTGNVSAVQELCWPFNTYDVNQEKEVRNEERRALEKLCKEQSFTIEISSQTDVSERLNVSDLTDTVRDLARVAPCFHPESCLYSKRSLLDEQQEQLVEFMKMESAAKKEANQESKGNADSVDAQQMEVLQDIIASMDEQSLVKDSKDLQMSAEMDEGCNDINISIIEKDDENEDVETSPCMNSHASDTEQTTTTDFIDIVTIVSRFDEGMDHNDTIQGDKPTSGLNMSTSDGTGYTANEDSLLSIEQSDLRDSSQIKHERKWRRTKTRKSKSFLSRLLFIKKSSKGEQSIPLLHGMCHSMDDQILSNDFDKPEKPSSRFGMSSLKFQRTRKI